MSIYQNGNKIMGENILDLNSDKVKQIADAEINSLVPNIKKNMLICPNDKSPKEFAIENSTYAQVIEFVQWTGTPHADSVAQYVTYKFVRGTDANWGTLIAITYELSKRTIKYCYYNGYQTTDDLKWGDWVTLIGTTIPDVHLTNITIPSGMFSPYNSNSYIRYEVKNGIAYFYIGIRNAAFSSTGVSFNIKVPKATTKIEHTIISENIQSVISIIIQDEDMQLWCLGGTNGTNFLATFSYPVAES